jgi:hypothetical protein
MTMRGVNDQNINARVYQRFNTLIGPCTYPNSGAHS